MSDPAPDPSARAPGSREPDPWGAMSLLIAGVGFWGGVGWLVARWLDNQFFVMVGLLLGMGGALFLIWFRYGKA